MASYSTWAYYSGSQYGGTLPEAEYTRRAMDAKYEIDRLTFGRAEDAPAAMADRLARCECRMLDAIAAAGALGAAAGVASVSNDGLSVSFEAGAAQAQQRELAGIARALLTQPVNLLYGGAVVHHAGV